MKIMKLIGLVLVILGSNSAFACEFGGCDILTTTHDTTTGSFDFGMFNQGGGASFGSEWTQSQINLEQNGNVLLGTNNSLTGGMSYNNGFFGGAGSEGVGDNPAETFVIGGMMNEGFINAAIDQESNESHINTALIGRGGTTALGDESYGLTTVSLGSSGETIIGGGVTANQNLDVTNLAGAYSAGENGGSSTTSAESFASGNGSFDLGSLSTVTTPHKGE